MIGSVLFRKPQRSALVDGDDLPGWIERDFDRRALGPRLAILAILLAGALADYGHGHRAGHWIVLVAYGAATLVAALGARSRSTVVRAWLPLAATLVDAAIAVYVIADHVPRHPGKALLATDPVSLLPAFLFLLQTGLRLRPRLTSLFAALVGTGWIASLFFLMAPSLLSPEAGISMRVREALNVVAFAAAAGFVLYASTWMRRAAASTMRAREERVMLSRFLPAGVASEVVRTGGTAGIAQRHATVISIDLRGSSALAREYAPAEVVEWLLDFRRLVHDAVTENGGIVDKYIGDGVIALFLDGVEGEQAGQAVATAEAIFVALDILNERRRAAGQPTLRVIAALHCGQVLAGVFDDGRRAEFTVLGSVMNDLSRIERRAKEANLDVVLSADVVTSLPSHVVERMSLRALAPPTHARALPALYSLAPQGLAVPRTASVTGRVRSPSPPSNTPQTLQVAPSALPMILAAALAVQGLPAGAAFEPPAISQPLDPGRQKDARDAAEQFLRHLYAVYFAVRGCSEASLQFGKPEYLSNVTLDEARRTMRVVDAAAKEVGLDVDRIWIEVAPLGLITAEALKVDRPDNAQKCREIGSVFRVDLGNLQNVVSKLGTKRPLIEKDF